MNVSTAATKYRLLGAATGRFIVEFSVKRRCFRVEVDDTGRKLQVTIGSRLAGPGTWDPASRTVRLHLGLRAAIMNANRTRPIRFDSVR